MHSCVYILLPAPPVNPWVGDLLVPHLMLNFPSGPTGPGPLFGPPCLVLTPGLESLADFCSRSLSLSASYYIFILLVTLFAL